MKIGDKYICKKDYYSFGCIIFHKGVIYRVEATILHFDNSELYKVYDVYFRGVDNRLYYIRNDVNLYDYFDSLNGVRKKKLNKLNSI